MVEIVTCQGELAWAGLGWAGLGLAGQLRTFFHCKAISGWDGMGWDISLNGTTPRAPLAVLIKILEIVEINKSI